MDIRASAAAALALPNRRQKPSEAAAESLTERQRSAREALNALKQANASQKTSRKAKAKERVDRLKAELQALRQFAAGSDPKAVARQAARIARELAAAVREYGGASGGSGIAAAEPAPQAAGDAAAPEGQAPAEGEAGAEAGARQAAETAQTARQQDEAAKPPAETAKEKQGKLQEGLAERQKQAGEREADAKFAAEVRRLLDQLKALMRAQRERAADDDEIKRHSDELGHTADAIDQALSGGGAGMALAALMPALGIDVTV